jgi:hypothetical protein
MTGVDSVLSVGRYGIEEYLASGATGVIFRGYDPVLQRPVAIKMLRRELAKGWNEQFKARARAAGQLFHPNIVATLDLGEDHDTPYRVSECVDGHSLARLLETSGPLAPQRAIFMINQVLEALRYSHESGILHLDIKPSSVLVLADDRIKLADFGTSPSDAIQPVRRVATTSLAPEQLTGGPVDERTDLFATGVLFFEMMTGSRPFPGADIEEVIAQMKSRGPEDLCALNPEVPIALRRVIETALADDPRQRFATAGAFSHAIYGAGSVPAGPAERGWDPEVLREIEADLARHIGPVAAIAVRRAARRAHDVAGLYDALGAHIESAREREEFLANARRFDIRSPEGLVSAIAEDPPGKAMTSGPLPREKPNPETLDAVEAQLAQYVGPIAKFLVKQQLQRFENLSKFYRDLAEHITDEAERAAFLNLPRPDRGTKSQKPHGNRDWR